MPQISEIFSQLGHEDLTNDEWDASKDRLLIKILKHRTLKEDKDMGIPASNFEWNGNEGRISRQKLTELCGGNVFECVEVTSDRTGQKLVFQRSEREPNTYHAHSSPEIMFKTYDDSISLPANFTVRDKYIVITGTLGETRETVYDRIVLRGGRIQNGITRHTDYLVVGQDPGKAKIAAATSSSNVTLIDGDEFMKYLDNPNYT